MPATRKGVASTKQGKGCLGTPESQGKTKDVENNISLRGPKGLRSKMMRLESYTCNLSWSYQNLVNDLANGTIVKIKLKNPRTCSLSFLRTDLNKVKAFKIN